MKLLIDTGNWGTNKAVRAYYYEKKRGKLDPLFEHEKENIVEKEWHSTNSRGYGWMRSAYDLTEGTRIQVKVWGIRGYTESLIYRVDSKAEVLERRFELDERNYALLKGNLVLERDIDQERIDRRKKKLDPNTGFEQPKPPEEEPTPLKEYNGELRRKALIHLVSFIDCASKDDMHPCLLESIEALQEDIGYSITWVNAVAMFRDIYGLGGGIPDYELWCVDEPGPFEDPQRAKERLAIQKKYPPKQEEEE